MVATATGYRELLGSGELEERVRAARHRLRRCDLCPLRCLVDRTLPGAPPPCRTGLWASVENHGPHHGEEDCLSGHRGAGAIFFGHCNMRCVFCRRWATVHRGGRQVDAAELAGMMLDLQARGCHNVDLVSPSHVVAQILEAVLLAARQGLEIPLVYNTGGYDSPEALALLDGVVDLYLPDMKFGAEEAARRYCQVPGYVEVNRAAIAEMHRQVGSLRVGDDGLAWRGLLVRHLVLPGDLGNSASVFEFLATRVSPATRVSVRADYRPSHLSSSYPPLDRRPTPEEVEQVRALAAEWGLADVEG